MLPTALEINEGIATPAAPMWRPKIHMAFPATLIRLIRIETFSVTWELPMERNSAAQALYTARNGKEKAEIVR